MNRLARDSFHSYILLAFPAALGDFGLVYVSSRHSKYQWLRQEALAASGAESSIPLVSIGTDEKSGLFRARDPRVVPSHRRKRAYNRHRNLLVPWAWAASLMIEFPCRWRQNSPWFPVEDEVARSMSRTTTCCSRGSSGPEHTGRSEQRSTLPVVEVSWRREATKTAREEAPKAED